MENVLSDSVHPLYVDPPYEGAPGFLQTIQNVLSASECEDILRLAEEHGFVPASLYTDANGKEYFSDTRKSSRCIIDSPAFVARLWSRIKSFVPATWGVSSCIGLNERLRILRYDPGDEFKPHSDGSYTAPSGASSKLTLLLYLNTGYEGGYTHFLHENGRDWIRIEPNVGSIAIQDQSLVHGVPPLLRGRKYALRTDVMYMPPPPQTGPVKEIQISL